MQDTSLESKDSKPAECNETSVPIMELRSICKAYGPVQALQNADLEIRRGEVHAIVGENGAGKSTLISIASGVLAADTGTIWYDGTEVRKPDAAKLRKAGISVTFQHPALAPDLTVLENLQLASPRLKGPGGFDEADRLLRQVATEQNWVPMNRRVADLTLAQQHIVEIVRALSTRPKVLFLDEPTEPFQEADIRKLFELISSLRAEGVAIVYVSHRLHEVDELADRVSVIRDSRIIDSRPADSITGDEIITLIVGRPLDQMFPEKSTELGEIVLDIQGLSGLGFDDINFTARGGEIVGVTGVEGEGQREFLRAIAGIGKKPGGSVKVKGKVLPGGNVTAARRAGVGFVTEDRHAEGLFLALSLRENIAIGAIGQVSSLGMVDRSREFAFSDDIVERLGVKAESRETAVSDLSGGNQQKVLIGRELGANPIVLLVDEPTKGVDVGARAEIYQRLRGLASQGVAVVVCSSDGIEHEGLCDRVAIFARGQIVKELSGNDVTDASITEANLTSKAARADSSVGTRSRDRWRRALASDHFPAVILAVLTAIVIGGTAAVSPYFTTAYNVNTILNFLAIVALVSVGQLLTILVGRIDLSVGALAGFVVVMASFLMPRDGSSATILGGAALILLAASAFGFL
jgi:ribose transport system ATP-binding protein